MQKNPLVSIVVPVYNCETYLREALSSLVAQSYKNFEVILVNDGSTDGSLSILEDFSKIDTRFRIINQKNSGIVNALNNGILNASGQLIARMDGDDVSLPNRLKEQVDVFLSNEKIILVAGDFDIIDEESDFMYREMVAPDDSDIKRGFLFRNPIAHGSVMIRKDILENPGPYRDIYGPTEDLDLWIRLMDSGEFSATGTTVYRWRVNTKGITSTNNSRSINESKQHFLRLWKSTDASATPIISRSELSAHGSSFTKKYKKRGHYYKQVYLKDLSQLSIRYITKGHIVKGLTQLLIITSTGRTGVKIVANRFALIIKGRFSR